MEGETVDSQGPVLVEPLRGPVRDDRFVTR